ncbi:MAG: TraM recognition domain-containing protein [Gemmataceae bacterium]
MYESDAINVIWCDEAQQFVNSHDAHYLAQCRSHKGCMLFLTQSLHSYYSALKGETGRHQADALLTKFHHKLFHALGDEQTAAWASGLIGKSLQTFVGGSAAPQEGLFDELNQGTPWLAFKLFPRIKDYGTAKGAEAFLVMAVGCLLGYGLDPALGWLLALGGIGCLCIEGFAAEVRKRRLQDMRDAEIEQRDLAERFRDGRF